MRNCRIYPPGFRFSQKRMINAIHLHITKKEGGGAISSNRRSLFHSMEPKINIIS